MVSREWRNGVQLELLLLPFLGLRSPGRPEHCQPQAARTAVAFFKVSSHWKTPSLARVAPTPAALSVSSPCCVAERLHPVGQAAGTAASAPRIWSARCGRAISYGTRPEMAGWLGRVAIFAAHLAALAWSQEASRWLERRWQAEGSESQRLPGLRQQAGPGSGKGLPRAGRYVDGPWKPHPDPAVVPQQHKENGAACVVPQQGPFGARGALEEVRGGYAASLPPGVRPLSQGHGAPARRSPEGECGAGGCPCC